MGRQVLLIDSEEATSFFLRQALEEDGYDVLWSRTSEEGMGTLAREPVDLVLLERELPDADGFEVLRSLRAEGRDGPGVVMIGPGSVGDAVEAMRLGAEDYLEKPLDLAILRETVSRALRGLDRSASRGAHPPDGRKSSVDADGSPGGGEPSAEREPVGDSRREARRARSFQRRAERLARLDTLTLRLLTSAGIEEAVSAVLDATLELEPVGRVAVFLRDPSRDEYRLVGQRLFPPEAFAERASRRLHTGYGLIQRLRGRTDPIFLKEKEGDPWYRGVVASVPGVGQGALVPIGRHGEMVGILLVVGHLGRTLTSSQLEELGSFASRLGAALHGVRRDSGGRPDWRDRAAGRVAREAWRSAPEAALVVDGEGRVVVASRKAERLLADPAALAGRSLDSVLGSEILPSARTPPSRWLPGWEEVEVRGRRLGVSIHPWEAGFGPGAVVLLEDLESRRGLERQRDRAGYGSALQTVSAVVAHEIRNPLAGIVTGIQHLAGQTEPDDPGHAGLQMILQESLRVKRVIEELLLLSRPVRLQLVPTDLGEALRTAAESYRSQAGSRGSGLAVHVDTGLKTIRADPDALQRAFRYLIQALLAGPLGSGSITATAGMAGEQAPGFAEVEIRLDGSMGEEGGDSGLKRAGFAVEEGAPLGLAVARRIVEAHGGEIESEGGPKGVTGFVVLLPVGG